MNRPIKPALPPQDEGGRSEPVLVDGAGPSRAATGARTTPVDFLRDVRGELRKVAWPSRTEVVNYSIVVLVTLVLIVALIFGFNYAFARGVTYLFQP